MKKRGLWFLLLLVVVCVVGIYLGCNKKENHLKDVKVADTTLTSRTYMNLSKVCT